MIKRLLVPIDGSEHSKKALEFACALCSRFEAELSVLHVVKNEAAEPSVMVLGVAHVTVPASPEDIDKAGRPVVDAACEFARTQGCEVARSAVTPGPPAKEILTYAKDNDVDTIVMGSRGLSDMAGMLLGSVSHKVSHLADCTCIVVR